MEANDENNTSSVQVLIWNNEHKHIALQTNNNYVGFDYTPQSTFNMTITKITSSQQENYLGLPDETLTLDGLDINTINKTIQAIPDQFEYLDLYENLPKTLENNEISITEDQYNILGSIRTQPNNNHSINALIFFILSIGGINRTLNINHLAEAIDVFKYDAVLDNRSKEHKNLCGEALPICGVPVTKNTVYIGTLLAFLGSGFIVLDRLTSDIPAAAYVGGAGAIVCFLCVCAGYSRWSSIRKTREPAQIELFNRIVDLIKRAKSTAYTGKDIELNVIDDSVGDNEVKIHIWVPKKREDFGHVTLKTQEVYASFWPQEVEKSSIMGTSGKLNTYDQDCLDMRCPPDETYTLNDVNVSLINDAYRRFSDENTNGNINWALVGSSIIGGKNRNCCGLTIGLLQEGNFDFYKRDTSARWLLTCSAYTISFLLLNILLAVFVFPFSSCEDGKTCMNPIIDLGLGFLILCQLSFFALVIRKTLFCQGAAFTPKGFNQYLRDHFKKEFIDGYNRYIPPFPPMDKEEVEDNTTANEHSQLLSAV